MSKVTNDQLADQFEDWLDTHTKPHPEWGYIKNSCILLECDPTTYENRFNDWTLNQLDKGELFYCTECKQYFDDKDDMEDTDITTCRDCLAWRIQHLRGKI